MTGGDTRTAAPRPRRRWPRRLLFGAVLCALLTALSLVVLELWLRAATDHVLGVTAQIRGMYRVLDDGTLLTTPGWRGEQTVEGRTTSVRLDSLGMRGPERSDPRAPGERRVLVLGDSFVWGYGVAEDEAFPARVEALLTRAGRPVRVGNAGAPGFGLREQCAALGAVRERFRPDVVVSCVYTGNDFEDETRRYQTVVDGYRLDGPMARFVERSWRARLALWSRTAFLVERWLDENLPSLAMDRAALAFATAEEIEAQRSLPPPAQRAAGLFMDRREPDAGVGAVLAACATSFERLRELAAPAPVLVVVIPTASHCDEGTWRAQLERIGFDPAQFERGLVGARVAGVARASGLGAVDLTPFLLGADPPAANWQPIGQHFSVEGHAFVAEQLVSEVLARL